MAKSKEPGWANVNRITLQEEFSTTNSGVMKLAVGEKITVKATVDYSGDSQPILQSSVQFENIDPALSIEHDPSSLVINRRKASFFFTITLTQHLTQPALFTIKVADRHPEDNQYLTPYSQRQAVEGGASTGNKDSTEPTDEGKTGSSTSTSEEKPNSTNTTSDENFDTTDTTTEETSDSTDMTTEGTPDITDSTTEETPDSTDTTTDGTPDSADITTEEKKEPIDITSEESNLTEEAHRILTNKEKSTTTDSASKLLLSKNENKHEINHDIFSNEGNTSKTERRRQLPQTADKNNPVFIYVGFATIAYLIFRIKK
ncbi:LPXTG cell wall anchor domain-containing protein [Enterococcus villorum]|uniref:Cell wall protein n=2 Tax=Enterococcus villorum TaxID=112904 RepID=A0A511IY34_9ENTE|nr:LPXTG cell wall anchor domain-containing protein [Enterococcus villorum]EOH89738.1 hypothetical protein UAO_00982 [Enterococcus villorum ATCC 700913]EOW77970.1 hypothetical protein I591_00825 [Enterococcus villorum ATCC 700913]GEL90687.1 hypothetical protein EVI01_00240 [Enterococcus villorum]